MRRVIKRWIEVRFQLWYNNPKWLTGLKTPTKKKKKSYHGNKKLLIRFAFYSTVDGRHCLENNTDGLKRGDNPRCATLAYLKGRSEAKNRAVSTLVYTHSHSALAVSFWLKAHIHHRPVSYDSVWSDQLLRGPDIIWRHHLIVSYIYWQSSMSYSRQTQSNR